MKEKMKKILILIAAISLSGCASTQIDKLSVANRALKLSILNVIVFEKTTEGLEIGGAKIDE
jgi:uncharacterized lipoprotein YmbA